MSDEREARIMDAQGNISTTRPWPKEGEAYTFIIAVGASADDEYAPFLVVSGPENAIEAFTEDGDEWPGMPKRPGVYVVTAEYWFQQGYYEGYPAPGESDYGFNIVDVVQLRLEQPAERPLPALPEPQ